MHDHPCPNCGAWCYGTLYVDGVFLHERNVVGCELCLCYTDDLTPCEPWEIVWEDE